MFKKIKEAIKEFLLVLKSADMSYSKIATYQMCPYLYKLKYVDFWKAPPNALLSLGQTIHRTLEKFHREKKNTLSELLAIYDSCWVNEGFKSQEEKMIIYERGKDILKKYFSDFQRTNPEVLYVEEKISFYHGRHKITCSVDRIDRYSDGTYEIIDYKTHPQPWSKEKVDSDHQLSIYAYAVRKCMKIVPSKLTYYFLSTGDKVSTERTKEQIEGTLKLFDETAQKILKSDFPPDRRKCKWCDFKEKCPESSEKGGSA